MKKLMLVVVLAGLNVLAGCSQAKADETNLGVSSLKIEVSRAIIEAQESVCLVTNATETPYFPSDGRNDFYLYAYNDRPVMRTEKWVRSVVVERKSLSFVWAGKAQVVWVETAISTNVVHLKLRQDWDVVPN